MSNKNYSHIFYLNCPHFTVGRVDQWGEQGYLFYEGMVYQYSEDRKSQYGETYNPRTVSEFLQDAAEKKLEIPADFLRVINEVS